MGRQLADEADRVGQQHRPAVGQLDAARRRVQGREQLRIDKDLRAGEGVQERGLAGAGITDERRGGELHPLARAALDRPPLAHLVQLLLQVPDVAADAAAILLQLRLARAAHADDAARLALEAGVD